MRGSTVSGLTISKLLKKLCNIYLCVFDLRLRDLCDLETRGPEAVAPECSKGAGL